MTPTLAFRLQACKDSLTSCVLDGEVVAYDREKKELLPFQVLSTRARKGATVDNVKVQVIYLAFDIIFVNGQVRFAQLAALQLLVHLN